MNGAVAVGRSGQQSLERCYHCSWQGADTTHHPRSSDSDGSQPCLTVLARVRATPALQMLRLRVDHNACLLPLYHWCSAIDSPFQFAIICFAEQLIALECGGKAVAGQTKQPAQTAAAAAAAVAQAATPARRRHAKTNEAMKQCHTCKHFLSGRGPRVGVPCLAVLRTSSRNPSGKFPGIPTTCCKRICFPVAP